MLVCFFCVVLYFLVHLLLPFQSKENITQHNKTSCSIILIEMATANVQENITQHKKSFLFSIILIEIATENVQENITQHKKAFF